MSRFLRTPWRSRSAARAVDSASLATGVALVRALAAFDSETAEHSAAVALYSRDVALHLGADADSGHAWRYGTSVRVSGGRDVFLEETKDSAVAIYSRDVALQLGADADSAAAIQLGALVHDVGKLALPAELLLKAEPLDEDEWALVRGHPEAEIGRAHV